MEEEEEEEEEEEDGKAYLVITSQLTVITADAAI